ncbi:hypothetical protein V2J09_002025 [Rumex salicifolius]
MEEDNTVSGGAEAILNLRPNSSISVAYHQDFGLHDELLLLEVDEKMLPDVLSQRVTIRGQLDEDAVFCTNSKTYSMKFVGTSNSAFLFPPSGQQASQDNLLDGDKNLVASALKLAPGSMELAEIAPRLDKLRWLISKKPFGPLELSAMEISEDTGTSTTGLYTWNDLIEQIQASDEELRLGLKALSAVEINGNWRILDETYMGNILSMVLHNAVLNDWSLNALNENEVVAVLEDDGFPSNLVIHCLDVHGKTVNGDVGSASIWQLDERRVCVQFAKGILRDGKMRMETFTDQWMRKIPSGLQPSLDMLEGEILTERFGIETWVRGFSVSSLPFSPAERFAVLFRERPKWEEKDLQPYIRDLKVPGLSSEGLLLKFTRRSQPTADSEPILSAR